MRDSRAFVASVSLCVCSSIQVNTSVEGLWNYTLIVIDPSLNTNSHTVFIMVIKDVRGDGRNLLLWLIIIIIGSIASVSAIVIVKRRKKPRAKKQAQLVEESHEIKPISKAPLQ